jgi:hypothetical protein
MKGALQLAAYDSGMSAVNLHVVHSNRRIRRGVLESEMAVTNPIGFWQRSHGSDGDLRARSLSSPAIMGLMYT